MVPNTEYRPTRAPSRPVRSRPVADHEPTPASVGVRGLSLDAPHRPPARRNRSSRRAVCLRLARRRPGSTPITTRRHNGSTLTTSTKGTSTDDTTNGGRHLGGGSTVILGRPSTPWGLRAHKRNTAEQPRGVTRGGRKRFWAFQLASAPPSGIESASPVAPSPTGRAARRTRRAAPWPIQGRRGRPPLPPPPRTQQPRTQRRTCTARHRRRALAPTRRIRPDSPNLTGKEGNKLLERGEIADPDDYRTDYGRRDDEWQLVLAAIDRVGVASN